MEPEDFSSVIRSILLVVLGRRKKKGIVDLADSFDHIC